MSVLAFDTETTDRKEGREIIEAAWIAIAADVGLMGNEPDRIPAVLQPAEIFCCRYRPTKPINFGALAVHHILPEELTECPPSSSFTLPEGVEYLIGHSCDFDWEAAGSPDVKRICTLAMSKHLWPQADSHSQSALLYQLLGMTPDTRALLQGAHSALTDARNNLLLLAAILEAKPDIKTWSALHAYSEDCRIPLYCPMKRWEGQLLTEMEDGAISWCLRQDFIDPWYRKGLERVVEQRQREYEEQRAARRRPLSETSSEDDGIPY
jgi:exodeoxyribonuclease X